VAMLWIMKTTALAAMELGVAAVCGMVLAGTVFGQGSGVGVGAETPKRLIIEHEAYELENGLDVILHVDRSLPQVVVNTWYYVGAKDEPARRSGFAHLFEHLMFMGTDRVPGNQFDVLMETGGGANNASTTLDRTNYFSWGPSNLLPTLLWLDAERLEAVGATMTGEKVRKQQDVVRNEIRQNVENTPYGKAFEYAHRFMFPAGHPYHFNVYGLHDDIEAATAETCRQFFATFYVPSNASLVVAGDFDPKVIKPLIAELFGTLPGGKKAQSVQAKPVELGRVIRTTMVDKVEQPMVMYCYHAPGNYEPGEAELTLATSILTSGASSRLYRRLVLEEQLAVDVSGYYEGAELGSVLRVFVTAKPEADLKVVERIMDEEIAKLAKEGPSEAELSARVREVELGIAQGMQSLLARADRLNEYMYYFGKPDALEEDVARYRGARRAAVASWAGKTMRDDSRLIIWVVPEELKEKYPAGEAMPTWRPEEQEVAGSQEAKGSSFAASARDKRPADLEVGAFEPTKPEVFEVVLDGSNGSQRAKVKLWERSSAPLVSMLLNIEPAGLLVTPGNAGAAALADKMLEEGVLALEGAIAGGASQDGLDGAAWTAAVQGLGARVNFSADHTSFSMRVSGLSSTIAQSSELAARAMYTPRLEEGDFARVKSNHLEELAQGAEDPPTVANRVSAMQFFGMKHPMGWPSVGTEKSAGSVTLESVKKIYGQLLDVDAKNTFYIAGDVSRVKATEMVKRFLELKGASRLTAVKGDRQAWCGANGD
jgi:zinc protease